MKSARCKTLVRLAILKLLGGDNCRLMLDVQGRKVNVPDQAFPPNDESVVTQQSSDPSQIDSRFCKLGEYL